MKSEIQTNYVEFDEMFENDTIIESFTGFIGKIVSSDETHITVEWDYDFLKDKRRVTYTKVESCMIFKFYRQYTHVEWDESETEEVFRLFPY